MDKPSKSKQQCIVLWDEAEAAGFLLKDGKRAVSPKALRDTRLLRIYSSPRLLRGSHS